MKPPADPLAVVYDKDRNRVGVTSGGLMCWLPPELTQAGLALVWTMERMNEEASRLRGIIAEAEAEALASDWPELKPDA